MLLLLLGDYYRYLCEIMQGDMKLLYQNESLISYQAAFNIAQQLEFTNRTKLTIYLNFSLFYYKVIF